MEIIIVNDGGDSAKVTDILQQKTQEYASVPKITLQNHKIPLGRGMAFNVGLYESSGEFVHCHDDDDTLHANL
jgi:glycosyltransferase involved in cell wall biosynthesis